MARFSKNALTQISGFDNQIIAGELVYNQATFWNLTLQIDDVPVDLTGATIDAQIIRRRIENVKDTRYGLSFDIFDYTPAPSPIDLEITNRADSVGLFTLVINDEAWGLVADDVGLDISSVNGIGYSGRIKISFPQQGSTPPQDWIIFLFFIVRSDGVIN